MEDRNRVFGMTMLRLQDSVNSQINREWRHAGNKWYRAIWTECAEMVEHVGWKWWKNQQPNIEQIQLELVDIWHFGLSSILERNESYDEALNELRTSFNILANTTTTESTIVKEEILSLIEDFALATLKTKSFNPEKFSILAGKCDLTLETIYRQYVGKNVLNKFRQSNGYKDGSYKKIWNGREDNEWLVELASSLNSDSDAYETELYSLLNAKYNKSE